MAGGPWRGIVSWVVLFGLVCFGVATPHKRIYSAATARAICGKEQACGGITVGARKAARSQAARAMAATVSWAIFSGEPPIWHF